jgi:hypothetical protein
MLGNYSIRSAGDANVALCTSNLDRKSWPHGQSPARYLADQIHSGSGPCRFSYYVRLRNTNQPVQFPLERFNASPNANWLAYSLSQHSLPGGQTRCHLIMRRTQSACNGYNFTITGICPGFMSLPKLSICTRGVCTCIVPNQLGCRWRRSRES